MDSIVFVVALLAVSVATTTSLTVTAMPKMVSVRVGEQLQLSCHIRFEINAETIGVIEVQWHRGSNSTTCYGSVSGDNTQCSIQSPTENDPCAQEPTTDNRGIVQYRTGNSNDASSTLTIANSNFNDSTIFVCRARRSGGTSFRQSNTISVVVLEQSLEESTTISLLQTSTLTTQDQDTKTTRINSSTDTIVRPSPTSANSPQTTAALESTTGPPQTTAALEATIGSPQTTAALEASTGPPQVSNSTTTILIIAVAGTVVILILILLVVIAFIILSRRKGKHPLGTSDEFQLSDVPLAETADASIHRASNDYDDPTVCGGLTTTQSPFTGNANRFVSIETPQVKTPSEAPPAYFEIERPRLSSPPAELPHHIKMGDALYASPQQTGRRSHDTGANHNGNDDTETEDAYPRTFAGYAEADCGRPDEPSHPRPIEADEDDVDNQLVDNVLDVSSNENVQMSPVYAQPKKKGAYPGTLEDEAGYAEADVGRPDEPSLPHPTEADEDDVDNQLVDNVLYVPSN